MVLTRAGDSFSEGTLLDQPALQACEPAAVKAYVAVDQPAVSWCFSRAGRLLRRSFAAGRLADVSGCLLGAGARAPSRVSLLPRPQPTPPGAHSARQGPPPPGLPPREPVMWLASGTILSLTPRRGPAPPSAFLFSPPSRALCTIAQLACCACKCAVQAAQANAQCKLRADRVGGNVCLIWIWTIMAPFDTCARCSLF